MEIERYKGGEEFPNIMVFFLSFLQEQIKKGKLETKNDFIDCTINSCGVKYNSDAIRLVERTMLNLGYVVLFKSYSVVRDDETSCHYKYKWEIKKYFKKCFVL